MSTLGDPPIDKGQKIREVFSTLNRKFEEEETQRVAAKLKVPYFEIGGFPIDQETLNLVREDEARAAQAIPFFSDKSRIKLGTADPTSNPFHKLVIRLEKGRYKVETYLVSHPGLHLAYDQYRKVLKTIGHDQHEIVVTPSADALQKLKALPENLKLLAETSATDMMVLIFSSAVAMNSSDIHLEPEKNDLKIRFRVDGVLQDIAAFPRSVVQSLNSRLKLLAGLKLNVTSIPQDGRFAVKISGNIVDLRVSALPSAYGESMVLRLLGMQNFGLDIEKQGLRGRALEVIKAELDKPNGMILTTGPTGSGKTTTLYAFLSYLNKPGVKIISLEDPVEYQLKGITQTPIDHSMGMDFAKGLRSILRQDPDIVMVGEIRDFETAETAAQAALTGHLVLSTLHTNDAAGAIPRLIDLGVKPVTLAPSLSALIAQRLLRRICESCKQVHKPDPAELSRVKLILSQISPLAGVKVPERLVFYHSPGCEKCHKLGYKGRVGAYEVFAVDDKIEKLIYDGGSSQDIKKQALANGMLTMQQDGILKALEGLTDLAEVWRTTEE